MAHRIELDSVKKHRNASEWRSVNRARCGTLESIGDGDNIKKLAVMMRDEGMSGPVEIWRGETPVFLTGTVEAWADGKVGKQEQPEWLRRAEQ